MRPGAQAGFSLIEVLVAFSIMALALGVLYQTSGGSVRAGVTAERTLRASLWAESLLDTYRDVPAGGLHESGRTEDDFAWQAWTTELPGAGEGQTGLRLYQLDIMLGWRDRGHDRQLHLTSVVQEAPRETPR